jgi:hypothetical protein
MFGSTRKIAAPESTEVCTSWYTDVQVLPVVSYYWYILYKLFDFQTFGGLEHEST